MNVQLRTGVSTSLAWLFAIASGLSVANVYYAQPLLDALARDFGISHAAVGGGITATQLGCALALLFLVPLGDRVDRRRLMAMQMLALTFALVAVGMAQSTLALLAGMLAVGLLGTAMTQGLIAYAASAAAPHEQGRVVGTAQGGVFIGLLLARVFAGGVSDLAGWRGVYFCAALLMLGIAFPLWRRLPILPPATRTLSYPHLLASMLTLMRQEKVLQVRGVLAMLMFAAFNIFWSALVLFSYPDWRIWPGGSGGCAGRCASRAVGRQGVCPANQRISAPGAAVGLVAAVADGGFTLGAGDGDCAAGPGRSGAARHQSEPDFPHPPGRA